MAEKDSEDSKIKIPSFAKAYGVTSTEDRDIYVGLGPVKHDKDLTDPVFFPVNIKKDRK